MLIEVYSFLSVTKQLVAEYLEIVHDIMSPVLFTSLCICKLLYSALSNLCSCNTIIDDDNARSRVRLSPQVLQPHVGLLNWLLNSVSNIGRKMIGRGKPKCYRTTLSTTNPTWTALGL